MRIYFSLLLAGILLCPLTASAQDRISSPRGEAATQIGGTFTDGAYTGGSWVVVDYGRPILRGRKQIFGVGESYGVAVSGGTPVWRVGANKSTRFTTERDLNIAGHRVAAGEYSLFIDLKEDVWTFILSNHKAKSSGSSTEEGLWGAYEYQMEMDVLRAPMVRSQNTVSVDQLTFSFVDMTPEGGTLAVMWENEVATIEFSIAAN
jgi:hypothetical protein